MLRLHVSDKDECTARYVQLSNVARIQMKDAGTMQDEDGKH